MIKKIKIICIIIIITNMLSTIFLGNIVYGVNQSTNSNITSINEDKYPGIKEKIKALQKEHPKWKFKILYTGISWKDVILYEYTGHGSSPKNLVPASSTYAGEWVCGCCGDELYDSNSWKCASVSAIKYMMDPRTALNTDDIFQFLELSYNKESEYSKEIAKNMVKQSFLDDEKYISTIMEASKKNNVNPYYIIARILQEQGKNGSVLVKGTGYSGQYVGYYNVFNIGAYGNTKDKVILNGLAKAKSYEWTSLEKALSEGIEIIAKNYIAVGQNTMYFQKFDVENSDGKLYWHQYMQNVLAAKSEGQTLKNTLINMNAIDYEYTFIIPVYENMPKNVSSKPENNKKTTNIDVDLISTNVTTSLKIRNGINGGTVVGYLYPNEIATRLEKATSKVGGTYWDKILKSNGTVGYVARCTFDTESTYKQYLIPINSVGSNNAQSNGNANQNTTTNANNTTNGNTSTNKNNTVSNSTNSNSTNNTTSNSSVGNTGNNAQNSNTTTNSKPANNSNTNTSTGNGTTNNYKKGDINEDGKIDSADLLTLLKYLLKKANLTDSQKKNSDLNADNKIDSADLLTLLKYLLGKIKL